MTIPSTRPPRPSTPAAAVAEAARFAERARQRRRTRWIRIWSGVGAFAVMIALAWLVCFSDVLAVKSVQVAGAHRLDAAQVERVANVPHGGSLALLDTGSIAARVRTLAPVADVSVERRFPNTVRIRITERTPAAVLVTPTGRYLVDDEGVAYATAGSDADKRYLVIESEQDSMTPESVVRVNEMIAALPEMVRSKVKAVRADTDQDMTAVLKDDRTIVWGGPEEPAFKAKVLDVLLHDKSTRSARTFDVSVPEAPTVRR
jgi:cell division protein FtsQ